MQNLCLDTRVVHSSPQHRIKHQNFCESVNPMQDKNKGEFSVIGKTKIYIVPPPLMTKDEYERRLDEVRNAGRAIIREMMERKKTK